VLAPLFLQNIADAASLRPETVSAWQAYVQGARFRMQERLQPGRRFLSVDEIEGMVDKLKGGEPFAFPLGRTPQKIPAGLIHDWQGIAFIPNVNIDDVLSTVRDYTHYTDFFHPTVMKSSVVNADGQKDRFSMLLANKSLILRTALDGDYESAYSRVDDRRWYSISETTRIQEVANYGTPEQRTLSENEGTGLIWKLLSITRFEQRDGGVYIETEVIALSRDIPATFRWIATPIVRRISKASLVTSLQQTSQAVCSRNLIALRAQPGEQRASQPRPTSPSASTLSSFR
jgi:hypothetical protein